ncbi:MAG: type VI secretion system TssO [Ferruginibacter sp.]
MQQILNIQERTQAFLKFLLFFLITVTLVVVAIYFNFRVPSKENAWLHDQLESQRTMDANQVKFVAKMDEAVILLDSLDKKDANTDLIQRSIGNIVGDMQGMVQNNKTLYDKMNKAIVFKFDELKNAKKDIQESKGYPSRISILETQLKECNNSLTAANAALKSSNNQTSQ